MKKNIIVFLVSTIITILVLEIIMRSIIEPSSNGISFGARNKAFEKKNYFLDENNFRNQNNDKDYELLYLGDSTTFGQGLKTDDIYANVVENLYGKRGYNLGIRGTNTIDQKIIYEKHLKNGEKKFSLIYQYYYNDIDYLNESIISPDIGEDNYITKISKQFFLLLSNNSYFFDYLITNSLILYLANRYSTDIFYDELIYKKHLKDVKKIFEISKSKNAKTLFLTMPVMYSKETIRISRESYIDFFKKNFFKICNKGDLLLDISIILDEIDHDKIIVNKLDYHASSYINKLIAQEINSALDGKNFNAQKC